MVAEPALIAVTRPLPLTVATPVALDTYWALDTVAPIAAVVDPASCPVVPAVNVRVAGVKLMAVHAAPAVVTVTEAVAVRCDGAYPVSEPVPVTVMTLIPGATAVTTAVTPPAATVATAVLLLEYTYVT